MPRFLIAISLWLAGSSLQAQTLNISVPSLKATAGPVFSLSPKRLGAEPAWPSETNALSLDFRIQETVPEEIERPDPEASLREFGRDLERGLAPDAPLGETAGLFHRFYSGGASRGEAVPVSMNRIAPPSGRSGPRRPTIDFKGLPLPRFAFSDEIRVSDKLVEAIDRVEDTLELGLYSFRIEKVYDAIARAAERDVKVRVVLDERHVYPRERSQVVGLRSVSDQIQALIDHPKIDVRILRGLGFYGSMHNKIAIFDGEAFVAGSYNWNSNADTANYESVIFRNDRARVKLTRRYFEWLFKNGYEFDPRGPRGEPEDLKGLPHDSRPSVEFNGKKFPRAVFSPKGRTEAWILEAIGRSDDSIEVSMFSFYSKPLAEALVAAKDRGVDVRVVADASQATRRSMIPFLMKSGVEVRLLNGHFDSGFDRMHNKWAIFDGKLVETGSFNWSMNAQINNFENAYFLNEAEETAGFGAKFEQLWAVGTPADERAYDAADALEVEMRGDGVPDGFGRRPFSDEDYSAE